jgi:hypothetical protein
MTSKEAYNYLLGLLESGGDMRWSLVKESMDKFKELVDQQDILEEYNVTPEILREVLLTGQMFRKQPTLSQCIKEWEEREFIVNNNELYIFLHHEQYGISMFINKKEIKYHVYHGYISLELNELLNKTLKALEVKE